MKKIFSTLLTICIMISICSCTSDNIDDNIIKTSNDLLEEWELEEGRTFSVVLDEQGIYHIDINGYELLLEREEPYYIEESDITNISECDSEVLRVVLASKDKVINYIDTSNILKDKEELIEYISDFPVKMADLPEDTPAMQNCETATIFINNLHREAICEWMIVHELVHALCQKTNGGVENERYPYNLFNEVLTDIITAGMEPEIISGIESSYSLYYNWVYLYLGCVGIQGIEAYFYGYDKILNKIPEAELDIFVKMFESIDYSEDAVIIICNCINDWGLEK